MITTTLSALSGGAIAGIVIGSIAALLLVFFLLTFTVYWFNLDMKFIYWFYNKMKVHYDHMERTHKL